MKAKAVALLLLAACALPMTPAPGVADERFDYVWAYYDGVAQFEKDGKLGLLDPSGNILTPAVYDSIDVQSVHQLRRVQKDGLTGMLDADGALWQGRLFEDLIWFSRENGLLIFRGVGGETSGLMRANGEIVHPDTWCDYEFLGPEINYLGESYGGQPIFWRVSDSDLGVGLMNSRGEWILPYMGGDPYFDYYTNGRIRFRPGKGGIRLCGAVGETGIVVEPVWDDVKLPTDGELFAVCFNGRWGFVDTTGEVVIPLEWAEVEMFKGNYAAVRAEDGRWGIINTKGELVIPAVWENLWHRHKAGSYDLAIVEDDHGKQGMIDMTGNIVVDFLWDDIRRYHEETALVQKDGRYGFVYNNEAVALPLPYDDVTYLSKTIYIMSKDGMDAYVGVDGIPLTPFAFKHTHSLFGFLIAEEALDWIPCFYPDESKGCVYINLQGEVMLEGEWIDGDPFFEGYARVEKRKKGRRGTLYGAIDKEGNEVIPCQYDYMIQDEGPLWRVEKDGVEGWIGPDFQMISGIKR